mgnify:CR=1 FL=1
MVLGTTLRKAERDEARRLATLAFDAWDTSIRPLLPDSPNMRERERLRQRAYTERAINNILVATTGNQLLGWIARTPGSIYIPYLMVAPEVQGQGIGTLLLHRTEALMELEGLDRVMLDTPADNVRAVQFYFSQGYHILAHAPGSAAARGLEGIRLEKRLNPFIGTIADHD